MRQRIRARRMQAGRAGTPQAAREAPGCARAQGSCRRRARLVRRRAARPGRARAVAVPADPGVFRSRVRADGNVSVRTLARALARGAGGLCEAVLTLPLQPMMG